MCLPNYDESSLQELHKFIADRHIPFRFTRAQTHTKTQYKRDKEEWRRLTAALDKADAAAIIRFTDLPPELRDEIYGYHLTEITAAELLTTAELRERMSCVSPQFWEEARDVLNRGEYNILPELALDDSHESSATPQLYRVLRSFSRQNSIRPRANRSSRSYVAFNPQEAFDHLSEMYALTLHTPLYRFVY